MLDLLPPTPRLRVMQVSDALPRLSQRAADLAAAGRHTEALLVWEELAAIEPGHKAVEAGLGAALMATGNVRRAAIMIGKACHRHPDDPTLLRLHGQALLRLGDAASAVGALYAAAQADPASSAIQATLALALQQLRKANLALTHAVKAFDAEPNVSNAALLSGILTDLGHPEEALAIIEGLPAEGPDQAGKLVLRSLCLQLLDRGEDALVSARQAIEAAPENSHARCALAMALLLRGQLTAEAWALYDSRAGMVGVRRWPAPERRWVGGDIRGKTLLIHAEQGFGDTLQFARYLPLIADRGARVILAVQPALRRLMAHVPGADLVVDGGGELPEFDVYCPLLSLPGIVGTTMDTVPPPLQLPPFPPPAVREAQLQVGLVWAGSGVFVDDGRRSLEPDKIAPLGDVAGVTFHSLQMGAKTLPLPDMRDAMVGVKDFVDTAERIAALDLIIAVDTSVAHLAATMGKPVWLLSRKGGCWRWLENRQDSPWYPSVRIYRQNALNDWEDVIGRVVDDLRFVVSKFEEIKSQTA